MEYIYRLVDRGEHEVMSLLSARLFLDTIRVSYQGFTTAENLAGRNVWDEAKECCEWFEEAGGRMVAAFGEGKMVGYAAYSPNRQRPEDYDWALEGFFVLPELQGRGIGTRLLAEAVGDMLRLEGKKLVVATFVGSPAEAYYYGTGASFIFETTNSYFGKPNRVSFLGWELSRLGEEMELRRGR